MKEDYKYHIIKELVDHDGNKKRASLKPNLSIRQINRLINIYLEKGKSGFVHGNRNRQPINRLPQRLINHIIKLYNQKYTGFNFAHFRDLLESEEGINVSYATIYNILNKSDISSLRYKEQLVVKKLKSDF